MLSALLRDERDAAQNPHRAERDDERVHAKPDDQRAVDGAAGRPIASDTASPSATVGTGIQRSRRSQDHRRRDTRKRVDRADREVDAAGDDDDRRADRHDREEAGVGRGLDQRVRVEKIVDRQRRCARSTCEPANDGQHAPEQQDDEDEPRLGDASVRLSMAGQRAYRDCSHAQTFGVDWRVCAQALDVGRRDEPGAGQRHLSPLSHMKARSGLRNIRLNQEL